MFQNVANGLSDEQKILSEEKLAHLVHEACKASNAHEFIVRLHNVRFLRHDDYDTPTDLAGLSNRSR